MKDANQEVRNTAKQGFQSLKSSIMDSYDWEKLLQRVLTDVQYKNVRDVVDKDLNCSTQNQYNSNNDLMIKNVN